MRKQQDPSPLRGTLGSSLRSPAEGEGNEGFPPPPTGTVSPFRAEQGTSLETPSRARASSCQAVGTTWFFSSCGGILELLCQAKRAPRAAFPSGCLAAQTKRWAEGIRVPGPLAGGGTTPVFLPGESQGREAWLAKPGWLPSMGSHPLLIATGEAIPLRPGESFEPRD